MILWSSVSITRVVMSNRRPNSSCAERAKATNWLLKYLDTSFPAHILRSNLLNWCSFPTPQLRDVEINSCHNFHNQRPLPMRCPSQFIWYWAWGCLNRENSPVVGETDLEADHEIGSQPWNGLGDRCEDASPSLGAWEESVTVFEDSLLMLQFSDVISRKPGCPWK
jgi:hypothetical protein